MRLLSKGFTMASEASPLRLIPNTSEYMGKLIQKLLTTREPDEQMIEVAIAAFNKVLEMEADETVPETQFMTGGILSKMLAATKKKLIFVSACPAT